MKKKIAILMISLIVFLPVAFAQSLTITKYSGQDGVNGYIKTQDQLNIEATARIPGERTIDPTQLKACMENQCDFFQNCNDIGNGYFNCSFFDPQISWFGQPFQLTVKLFDDIGNLAKKETKEIIDGLNKYPHHLIVGNPASGKTVLLKEIGRVLEEDDYNVFVLELKLDDMEKYEEDILKLKEVSSVVLIDDAHLQWNECNSLLKKIKNEIKIIITTRPFLEASPTVTTPIKMLDTPDTKTEIKAEDVAEGIIKRYLKKEFKFSNKKIWTSLRKTCGTLRGHCWHSIRIKILLNGKMFTKKLKTTFLMYLLVRTSILKPMMFFWFCLLSISMKYRLKRGSWLRIWN